MRYPRAKFCARYIGYSDAVPASKIPCNPPRAPSYDHACYPRAGPCARHIWRRAVMARTTAGGVNDDSKFSIEKVEFPMFRLEKV
jgi:hypothetical protein